MQSPSHLSNRIVFIVVLALTLSAPVTAQDTGVVTGRILDAAGNAVMGANVSIVGTRLAVASADRGSFRLKVVPAGPQQLLVTYLGYGAHTADLEVVAREVLTHDVILEVFGDEIEVRSTPLLEGQAEALNRQKNAINITNIVAADQIGRFPDKNTAEATQRIPAITLLRDQGEGRYALVRGTEARLNSTTINGERIPSPEAGTRDIALDVIPADLLQSIKVSKALTPDMDGDSIGGTIDLITKRAPEQRHISGTLGLGYTEIVEDTITTGNFTYGSRFGEKKTGLLFSASANVADRGSQNFEPEYDDGFLKENGLRNYEITRERYGATFSLDHQGSERTLYYLRGVWNNFQDTETRRAKVENVDDGEIEREIKDRLQESTINSLTAGGSYLAGRSSYDYRVAWNRAEETTPDQVTSVFIQEDVDFNSNVTPNSINPNNIQTNPGNEDINEFLFDEIETEFKDNTEEDFVAAFDYSRGFFRNASFSGLWKTGVKARFKDKEQDVTVDAWELDDDLYLTDVLSGWTSATEFLFGRYDIGQFQDPEAMRDLLASGLLESERIIEEDLADFTISEDTLAAYGLVDLALGGKTSLLAGLRVEDTSNDYKANELIFDDEGDASALNPVSGSSDYTQWLPMFHLRYMVGENSNLRAAVTRTLARPNFEDLAPFQLTNFEDEEIVRGNPDLNVTTSWNLDLLFEKFLEPLGIVSAGVYYKKLDDIIFISTFEEDFLGNEFDVEMPVNGETATLLGLEAAYQQKFTKLASPWDGLGLYANYTFSSSDAEYPDRPSTTLQGQAENVGNLALSYEKYGFTTRISANYNSEYILAVGGEPAEDLWLDSHLQFDFLARYQFTEKFSVYLEMINLGDEPY
ncbi:MAG: TonB-dependent receptor, partial [Thermoanaerobaculia bacterium]